MTNFNFDEWAALYNTDPVGFENRRKELLANEITKAPVKSRNTLRVIQMECDVIRNMHEPLVAAQLISEMMISRLANLGEQLTRLQDTLK
jgi:hypothetical protein